MGKHNIIILWQCMCLSKSSIKIKLLKKLYQNYRCSRRMTKIFEKNKNEFYDDYATIPRNIFRVRGVKGFKTKITAVFQPHRFQGKLITENFLIHLSILIK